MQRTETVQRVLYYSAVHPELVTDDPHLGKVIEWADANPVVWKIVRNNKSKVFGKSSSEYMGSSRGDAPDAVLCRASHFRQQIEPHFDPPASQKPATFWMWRAKFTLEHYEDKGFRGGFFHQWDGTYDRGCANLDYTPKTLDEVIGRFVEWCGSTFETVEVRVDKKPVAAMKGGKLVLL